MNANQPPESAPLPDPHAANGGQVTGGAWEGGGPLPWKRLRLFALGSLAFVGSFLLCLGMLTSSAAWYTSRSQFCSSCHIMDPYYASWEQSAHSHVACVKCHFAPGIGEKVRGKMQGLVQLCTYIIRSEGPRPVAEVPDSSCLRSGCHETRSLAGPLQFHGIVFDHAPHLAELQVGGPIKDDLDHGMNLRCTSCHGQAEQSQHMTVNTATCFLCHFKHGHFNEGAGACTRCHQIPDKRFELGGGMSFTHELAYGNGVDCKSCHGGLTRGEGEVTRVRCQVCHNREIDLQKFADAKLMHDIHVTDHKVDCMECHGEIVHSIEPQKLAHAASNCASCHPNHHQEQVNMLQGVGGLTVPDQTASMSAVNIECMACHRVRQVSATGTVLWKASANVCIACHTSAEPSELETYQHEFRDSLADIAAAQERARAAMGVADLDATQLADVNATLAKLAHDLEFLSVANGIHNIHYATTLTRALFDGTATLCRQLKVAEPTVKLPDSVRSFQTQASTVGPQ